MGSDHVLGLLFRGDPGALLFAGSFKGLVFVGVTALLLFVVLYLGVGTARADDAGAARRSADVEVWKPLAIFALAAVAIAAAGVSLYRSQADEIRRNRASELHAIADLKVAQIEFWLEDRRQGLEQAASSPFFHAAVEGWLAGDRSDVGKLLDVRLEGIRQGDDFEAVQVLAADGRLLKIVGTPFDLTDEVRRAIHSAPGAAPAASGFGVARSADGTAIVIDHFAAIRTATDAPTRPLGFIVARSDPRRFLLPLATAWPFEKSTGESLLIRREGDYVVALSDVRYPDRAPAGRRVPMSRTDLAGVRVVLGERGPFETYDYRGVPALAVGTPVRGTNWFLLAKVDLAEVHAPLIRLMLMASGLVAAALLAAAALVVLWWRNEKQRMGLALERAEQRVSALVEHFAWSSRFANDMVVLLDEQGRILEANDRALGAYGYSRGDLIGRSLFELELHGADAGSAVEVRRNFDSIKQAGQLRFEALHRRKDGTRLPVEISSRRMDVGGRTYVQSIMRDITERRAQEERIAEISAERDKLLKRLELQFERMPIGCAVSGPDFRVRQVNSAFERIFGYSREEFDQDSWSLIVPEELREWILTQLAPLATSDAAITLVNENLTKSGARITCRWTNTALHGPSGDFLGHIGMCEDITQQIATERALRGSEERFRALAEVSPAVVFRTDMERRCTYVNARWREVSGMEPPTALELGWLETVHRDDRAAVAEAWQATVAGANFRREYRLDRPDGSVAWVLGQMTREYGENGQVMGFVGTLTDITDLKATELELQESRARLEERVRERTSELAAAKERAEHADRVKSTFLSMMSHELRTPLNSILGFTDVVLEGLSGPLTDEQRRHLGIVRDSSLHLLGLINDVLDLSRIEAGQLRFEIASVELPDLLRRRVQGFETEAARKGLALSAAIGAGVGVIQSDARRVSQIIDNLLANAVKFTDTGSVSLAAQIVDDTVEVAVSDTGPGIAPGDLGRLFEPFFTQAVGTADRTHEGIGLGLPISRNLARALGGTVRVSSEPGRGSCFTVALPLAGPGWT